MSLALSDHGLFILIWNLNKLDQKFLLGGILQIFWSSFLWSPIFKCFYHDKPRESENEKVNIIPFIFCIFSVFVEVNIFTLLALKSKRIELLSSAWRHFEDFFKFFPMVTDFDRFFLVVSSQISHIGGTFILVKMVE